MSATSVDAESDGNAWPTPNSTYANDTESAKDDLINKLYLYSIPPIVIFCLVTFIVNTVIVASSIWIRRPLSPTLSISISLASADAYASLVVGIGLVINSLLPVGLGVSLGPNVICYTLVLEAFRLGGIISSVAHLTALAINHYIGILRPLHYASTMTPRTTTILITLLWVLPIAFFFIYFWSMENMGFRSPHCAYEFILYKKFRFIFCSMFFAPLGVMGVIYCHIFVIVQRHQASRRRYQNSNQLARSVKAVKTTVLILGTYVLGWMPAVLVYCLVCADCVLNFQFTDRVTMFYVYTTCNFLYILKTLVDPIIYAARMQEIQLALRKMRAHFFGGSEPQPRLGSEQSQQRLSTFPSRKLRADSTCRSVNGSERSTNLTNTSLYGHRSILLNPTKGSSVVDSDDVRVTSSLI